jgi:hypothetical protein
MPSIGQTWVLALYIGAVIEMGILSTLKRMPMESTWYLVDENLSTHYDILPTAFAGARVKYCYGCQIEIICHRIHV